MGGNDHVCNHIEELVTHRNNIANLNDNVKTIQKTINPLPAMKVTLDRIDKKVFNGLSKEISDAIIKAAESLTVKRGVSSITYWKSVIGLILAWASSMVLLFKLLS